MRQELPGALRLMLIAVAVGATIACGGSNTSLTELQRVRADALTVVVLSSRDSLAHGMDRLVIEFRSPDDKPVDVGTVRASASMSMSGTPMFGSMNVERTDIAGRYAATTDFSMAGSW